MNVYDFDNTIYDGESAVDFFKFCLRRKPKIIKFFPLVVVKLAKYKLCLIQSDELRRYVEKYADEFIALFDDIDKVVAEFWDSHFSKIKSFYMEQKRPDDVIISASFDFLLKIPLEKLGAHNLISSVIDMETGQLTQLCFRENKPELFAKHFPDAGKFVFYTDSMNDAPMIEISDTAYLVKGNKLKKIK